jgi:hypothetical protein
MKKIVFLLLMLVVTIVAVGQQTTRAEYIERYKHIAIADMEKYGIPASIKMAQGILESNSGNARLAREANNHFGIKCKKDWTGDKISHDDDEKGECFRKYSKAEVSWHDHSEFLDKGARYQFLFELDPTDYKAWAHGLKQAGYATDKEYPAKLIKIIEENELYRLDRGEQISLDEIMAREEAAAAEGNYSYQNAAQINIDNYVVAMHQEGGYDIYSNNGVLFVVAAEGDNLAKLSVTLGIGQKRLRRFNDLLPNQNIVEGMIIYIQAKKSRSNIGSLIHTVQEGETLRSISQTYGIKLRALARRNRYSPDVKLIKGQQIKI